MNKEYQAFISAIEADPYNEVNRKVFADWLDENDRPEEADLFRSWTLEKHKESEKWLTNFAKEIQNKYTEYYSDYDEYYGAQTTTDILTYKKLIEIGHECLDRKYGYDLPFQTPDIVFTENLNFWKHFQIVTCRPVSDIDYTGSGLIQIFNCSC